MTVHGALDRLLEFDVEREAEVAPGERVLPRGGIDEALGVGARPIAAARVDDPLLPSALPSQVTLPRVLDTRCANHVTWFVVERIDLQALFGRQVLKAN